MINEIYKAFLRVQGYVLGVIGLIATWFLWVYAADERWPLKWLVPLFALALVVIITLFECARSLLQDRRSVLPKVVRAMAPQEIFRPAHALILLSSSPIFGHEAVVSIYVRDTQFELLAGAGVVVAIQENGLIQVVVKESYTEEKDFWSKVTGNDPEILQSIIVKPGIVSASKLGD